MSDLRAIYGWRSALDEQIEAEVLARSRLSIASFMTPELIMDAKFDVMAMLKSEMARKLALALKDRLEISCLPTGYCCEFSATLHVFTEEELKFLVNSIKRREGWPSVTSSSARR